MSERNRPRDPKKRKAIIEAAKTAFTEFGIQNTSMDKLAQQADVSKRTVYNHFENKEKLVTEILSDLWKSALMQVEFKSTPDQSLRDQLVALTKAEIDVICSEQYIELARIAFEHFMRQPEALQDVFSQIQIQEATLYKVIAKAIEDKELKPVEVKFAYDQLHILVKGRCFWPQFAKVEPILNEEQKMEVANISVDMFLAYFEA